MFLCKKHKVKKRKIKQIIFAVKTELELAFSQEINDQDKLTLVLRKKTLFFFFEDWNHRFQLSTLSKNKNIINNNKMKSQALGKIRILIFCIEKEDYANELKNLLDNIFKSKKKIF